MSVQFNEAFFVELGRSPAVVARLRAKAERIAAEARATAPKDTEAYTNSIHVEQAERNGRTVMLVIADDPGALAIEARTGNLARAARRG